MISIHEQEALQLVRHALETNGASLTMATSTSHALVLAEMQGITTHGLSRVSQYVSHLKNGRVDGRATPKIIREMGATVIVDAGCGLAFPACDMAVIEAVTRAKKHGVAFSGVINSHHCGVLGNHLHPLQHAGMIGIALANAPASMPAAGGKNPIFGTNPIAALFPRQNATPLEIDLALSEVSRGRLIAAAEKTEPIPLGWALDKDGNPTTSPHAGLDGAMLPFGSRSGQKGALLALIVELLVTALIGTHFSYEASNMFTPEGNRPRLGHAFLAINPGALAGQKSYFNRLETFIEQLLRDDSTRLPGDSRHKNITLAKANGIQISSKLYASLIALGQHT